MTDKLLNSTEVRPIEVWRKIIKHRARLSRINFHLELVTGGRKYVAVPNTYRIDPGTGYNI